MARCRFCHGAELHRRLGQPAQRLIENTRLGALEIRRTLHCLHVEISVGELAAFGGDSLGVGIGVEKNFNETIGASSESPHELNELW
jgi:hypothetical protein